MMGRAESTYSTPTTSFALKRPGKSASDHCRYKMMTSGTNIATPSTPNLPRYRSRFNRVSAGERINSTFDKSC